MADRVATIAGVMLAPGVSANGRYYSPAAIESAYKRLAARIASGSPVTMLTHHGAGDDSTRIAGRLTNVTLRPDTKIAFEADLAPTNAGHDIAALVTPDRPYLANVSIRGWWVGPVKTTTVDGTSCETADDLEIDGLDFTKTPGVEAARIETATTVTETGAVRTPISESVEKVMFVEAVEEHALTDGRCVCEADTTPYGDVTYADPGYQKDKKKRYPIDTKPHVKAAWSYINQGDNARAYTPAQLKRIKGRIKSAAKKFGVTISSDETHTAGARMITEDTTRFSEVSECYADSGSGFSISAFNGPININLSCYNLNDPSSLKSVAAAAMAAACDALSALDPDMDADIDVPGAPGEDTDGDAQETQTTATTQVAAETKEPSVAETQTPAAESANSEAPQVVSITKEDLIEAFTAAMKAAAPAVETPAATETVAETAPVTEAAADVAALVAAQVTEAVNALREELVKEGTVERKGFRRVTESGETEVDVTKVYDNRGDVIAAALLGLDIDPLASAS
jgi:hypothetical protein